MSSIGKIPSYHKVCAADRFGGEGFLDMRIVVKHGRSLTEGSSALGRLLTGGNVCAPALRVSANFSKI